MVEIREKGPKADISGVVNRLRLIPGAEIQAMLDTKHGADPLAGIAIVNLTDMAPEISGGQKFHFHGARVFTSTPETPNFVNPHYHLIGEEPYRMLSSRGGEMNLGRVVDGKVVWDAPKAVETEEVVVVGEGQVHSLRNTGTEPFDFLFACPDSHLVDHSEEKPEGDRYFTKDLPNGIPPQYPK
ncbi:MAG: hypothetical protein ACHQT7_00420 [Candidatus Levyibacteriota bacterium]